LDYDKIKAWVLYVQEQLAFHGIILHHETVRDWCRKFANHFKDVIKKRERKPSDTWHLDEMTVKINGEPFNIVACSG